MVKKEIIVFQFLLLAYVILLAHAVIPHSHHRHHEDHPVAIPQSGHSHDVPHHEHERTGDQGNHAFFFLDQDVVLRLSQQRQSIPDYVAQDDHVLHFTDAGLVNGYSTIEYLPVLFSDASIPLLSSAYSQFLRVSCGLRAPPSA